MSTISSDYLVDALKRVKSGKGKLTRGGPSIKIEDGYYDANHVSVEPNPNTRLYAYTFSNFGTPQLPIKIETEQGEVATLFMAIGDMPLIATAFTDEDTVYDMPPMPLPGISSAQEIDEYISMWLDTVNGGYQVPFRVVDGYPAVWSFEGARVPESKRFDFKLVRVVGKMNQKGDKVVYPDEKDWGNRIDEVFKLQLEIMGDRNGLNGYSHAQIYTQHIVYPFGYDDDGNLGWYTKIDKDTGEVVMTVDTADFVRIYEGFTGNNEFEVYPHTQGDNPFDTYNVLPGLNEKGSGLTEDGEPVPYGISASVSYNAKGYIKVNFRDCESIVSEDTLTVNAVLATLKANKENTGKPDKRTKTQAKTAKKRKPVKKEDDSTDEADKPAKTSKPKKTQKPVKASAKAVSSLRKAVAEAQEPISEDEIPF